MKDSIAEKFRECLLENFPWSKEIEFSYTDDLFEKGIIDSLGFLTVISFIENNFDIQVRDEDIIPENFSTIQGMTEYVSKEFKKKNAA